MKDVLLIETTYCRYDSLLIKDQSPIFHLKLTPGIQ